MIKVLGQRVSVQRYGRACRDFCSYSRPSIYGRIYRENGVQRASLTVGGQDEVGCYVDIRVRAKDLRDCEVAILAALERRGLRSWADRLMGGAA